jgi:DNA-binding transcriptional ArsR family regulator
MAAWLHAVDPDGRLVARLLELDGAEAFKALANPLRLAILKLLAQRPRYPAEVAKELGVGEQLVYYHIARMKKAGLIEEAGFERRRGAVAARYKLSADGVAILFRKKASGSVTVLSPILDHLLSEGKGLVIVLGSPEPHGPFRGRGRDHYLAARLAYAIGASYGSKVGLDVVLDTDPKLNLSSANLIVVGGPAANMVTARLNEKLPIRFDVERGFALVSRCSGKVYSDDNCGVIELVETPEGSLALILAGVHLPGTKAAFTALFKLGEQLAEPNAYEGKFIAHVVEGIDADGDGEIDDVSLLE